MLLNDWCFLLKPQLREYQQPELEVISLLNILEDLLCSFSCFLLYITVIFKLLYTIEWVDVRELGRM